MFSFFSEKAKDDTLDKPLKRNWIDHRTHMFNYWIDNLTQPCPNLFFGALKNFYNGTVENGLLPHWIMKKGETVFSMLPS